MPSEYIRPHASPSSSSLLGIPGVRDLARFTLLHAGASSWPTDDVGPTAAAERGHSHPVYHALLYTGGSNAMIHLGKKTEFRRGTLVLTDPGVVHEYRPQNSGGGSFLELTFDLREGNQSVTKPWTDIFTTWFDIRLPRNPTPFLISPPKLEEIESQMERLIAIVLAAGKYRDSAAALSAGPLLFTLATLFNESPFENRDSEQDPIERARSHLERNFTLPISTGELSEVACMTPGAFIRSFSRRFGVPPMAYRKKLRINAAKHLLAVSGRSVGEIASNVGYKDIFAFSRTFRTETGYSASEWRKMREGRDTESPSATLSREKSSP